MLPGFRISEESSSRKISQHWVLWLSTLVIIPVCYEQMLCVGPDLYFTHKFYIKKILAI